MTANAIEAISLSKSFKVRTERRTSLKERLVRGKEPPAKEFWALRDASFSVPKGSSLGLIGQNGSGKSTALKVLAGIYRPTSGEVRVNGSVSALLEVGAGFHPELTGRENIRLNATILGFTKREIDRLMDKIIEFADIGDHIDGPIKHYSSGMYVRLGFAVAVMVRPEILLVDEVIAVGDEEFQRKCYEYLYELRRAGTSMIVVSHGMNSITDLCDHAVLLENGNVRSFGVASQVVRTYLEGVNQREIERLNAAPAAPEADTDADSVDESAPEVAPEPPRRRGSGDLRITGVEFLDAGLQPVVAVVSGTTAILRFHYEAQVELTDFLIGFGIDDQMGRRVCGVNSRDLSPLVISPGVGWIDFRFEPALMAGGTYQVLAEAVNGSHVVDAVDDGPWFKVLPSGADVTGFYQQPGMWAAAQTSHTSSEPVSVGAAVPDRG